MCAKPDTPRVPYEKFPSYPGKPFQLPKEKHSLLCQFWTVRVAARRWGCTYRSARLWMLRHPDKCVLVRVWHLHAPKPRWILTVKANTAKIPAMKGNPDFLNVEWQRRMAIERWHRKRVGPDRADPDRHR